MDFLTSLAIAVLLLLSSAPCMVLGVNFTTIPAPDDQNTFSFCLNGDGSHEPIRTFCSWTMSPFGIIILPQVNIGLPNGENVSLSLEDDDLATFGIETGSLNTTGGIHTLPLLITPRPAINGSTIGCSEGRISSTKITFIARCRVDKSSIIRASTATVTTILPTQSRTQLPMATMEPSMSFAPTPSSTPTTIGSISTAAVAIALPIITVTLVTAAVGLGFFAARRNGCIGKKRIMKTSEAVEEVSGDSTEILLQSVSQEAVEEVGGDSTDVLLQDEPQLSAEPNPYLIDLDENHSKIYGADRPRNHGTYFSILLNPLVDLQTNFKVANSGEYQPDVCPSQDDPQYEFHPMDGCPRLRGFPPEKMPPDDTEMLLDNTSETVPSQPLCERDTSDSGHETKAMPYGGSSDSSLWKHDRDPPDNDELVQHRPLQSCDSSEYKPEHLRDNQLNRNIYDTKISAVAQQQEVPVMPKGLIHSSSSSLSEIANTQQLRKSCFILGDIHTISLTHLGGTFPLYPFGPPEGVGNPQVECCATLEAPPGVVERGVNLCVYYAIILDGPFKFPENWKRTSVVLYIDCPDNHLMLEPVKLSLHHWAAVGPRSSMSFMKSNHILEEGQNMFKFKHHAVIFPSNTRVANLYLKNHFCLVCTAANKFELGMSRYYGMLVIDPLKDGVQKFWLCLTYAVPTWMKAVKEYFRREENSKEEPVIPEYQELELGSDDKVSLQVDTMSGPGWALTVTKEEIWLKQVDSLSSFSTCEEKEVAVRQGLYPPTAHFKITYERDPSPATHVRKPNFATLSSNADSKLHFTVHEKNINPSMMNPARASLTDSSCTSSYEEDGFQRLMATKEFTLQNLMPYLNDLADVGFQIAGWLGMEHEFSVIEKTPGVATSLQAQLQVLLTKWLEDSVQPNAPHDWEFFIRVVRGVNKGKLAERIKKEVFKAVESDQTTSLHSEEDCQDAHLSDEMAYMSEDCIPHWAEEMAPYWFVFGRKLGFSEEELQNFRQSNDCGNTVDSDKACCSVMLHRWVRTGNQKEKTHDRLWLAMKEVKKAHQRDHAAEEFEPPTYSDIAFST